MNSIFTIRRMSKPAVIKLLSLLVLLSVLLGAGNASEAFAHGGEDHGDGESKTTASGKGMVSHTARLGDFELMLKHPLLEPDTATSARLFVTDFKTNTPAGDVGPAVEVESSNGAVTQAAIEKTDTVGSYVVKIPALPEGAYLVRAKLTYKGETDTATFSGVEVKTQPTLSAAEGEISWTRFALIAFVFALVLALFGGLVFFVWRSTASSETVEGELNESKPLEVKKETVSA